MTNCPNLLFYKFTIRKHYVKNFNYEKICNKPNDNFHNYMPWQHYFSLLSQYNVIHLMTAFCNKIFCPINHQRRLKSKIIQDYLEDIKIWLYFSKNFLWIFYCKPWPISFSIPTWWSWSRPRGIRIRTTRGWRAGASWCASSRGLMISRRLSWMTATISRSAMPIVLD